MKAIFHRPTRQSLKLYLSVVCSFFVLSSIWWLPGFGQVNSISGLENSSAHAQQVNSVTSPTPNSTANESTTLESSPSARSLIGSSPTPTATESTVESVPLATPLPTIVNPALNQSLSLSTSPPRLGDDYSLILQPGEQRQIMIEIHNPSAQTINVVSSTKDFILGGEDGETPIPVDDTDLAGKWSLSPWLTLEGTVHTLEPQSSATIPVLISVPETALPGGHYAMILHRPIATQNNEAVGTQINTQVGNLVYVIVDGSLQESINITDFTFNNFHEKGPIGYRFTVENESNYHISPQGHIEIRNIFGRIIDTLPITSNKNIFPASMRQYAGKWDKNWGLGPYTATLSLAYGQDNLKAQAEYTFWILPVRIIVLIILIIVGLVVTAQGVKNRKKKLLQKKQRKNNDHEDEAAEVEEVADGGSKSKPQSKSSAKTKKPTKATNSKSKSASTKSNTADDIDANDSAAGPESHLNDSDNLAF